MCRVGVPRNPMAMEDGCLVQGKGLLTHLRFHVGRRRRGVTRDVADEGERLLSLQVLGAHGPVSPTAQAEDLVRRFRADEETRIDAAQAPEGTEAGLHREVHR